MIPQTEPIVCRAPDADAMRAIGERLATLLRPGDLIIATGELGAGKTTFTQGLGAGLGVEGPVISPTFVLSRIHRGRDGRPDLVHVDAYRLVDSAELVDLDLEESMPRSITLVEWGEGKAEELAQDRVELFIARSSDPDDETRTVEFVGVGPRWQQAGLESLAGEEEGR